MIESSAGRAFESAAALYIFIVLVVLSFVLWLWGWVQIRTYHRGERPGEEGSDQNGPDQKSGDQEG